MKIYKINDKKFKGIYLSMNFLMQSDKEVLSKNAVMASMLSKESKKFGKEKDIQMYLASLYGANFSVNLEKLGDVENLEFKIECVNQNCIENTNEIVLKSVDFLKEITLNAKINEKEFNDELFEREKLFILEKIASRKDEKLKYAVNRTEEIMNEDSGFGTFLYGNEEIVKKLSKKDIVEAYNSLINDSKVIFIVSGNLEGIPDIEKYISDTININNHVIDGNLIVNVKNEVEYKNEIIEKCDSTQSVITAALKLEDITEDDEYVLNVYNAILGGTPSSKLFQIFREKESLAYTARSRYYRYKDLIIIYAGINKENYEKSKEVIRSILDSIEKGDISDEEFNAAKTSLIADIKEWEDSKIMLSKFLLSNLLIYKNKNRTLRLMQEKINNVTKEDVMEISKKVKFKMWYLLGGEINE